MHYPPNFWPVKALKILNAGFFCGKLFVKLLQCSRIIYSASWIKIMAHEPTVTLSQRNGYPSYDSIFSKLRLGLKPHNSVQLGSCVSPDLHLFYNIHPSRLTPLYGHPLYSNNLKDSPIRALSI